MCVHDMYIVQCHDTMLRTIETYRFYAVESMQLNILDNFEQGGCFKVLDIPVVPLLPLRRLAIHFLLTRTSGNGIFWHFFLF